MPLPSDHCRQLHELGFVVLDDFIPAGMLDELRTEVERLYAAEGERAGSEFKTEPGSRRLANLADKAAVFRRAMRDPRLTAYVEAVLGPEFKISSINARSANPQNGITQPLHADMSAVPDDRGNWVCNSLWMLDDFTSENGSLRLIPGSHHFGRLPQDVLTDPMAPHPDELRITGRAGTVAVINAHVWHGALPNQTDSPRRAVHVFFCRRDKPQQQYQKELLSQETQSRLSPRERWLLALDDPLNDRLSREHAIRSGFLK